MYENPEFRLERMLARVVAFVLRFALPTILVALALTGISIRYVAGNLGINTDTEDMLSPTLEWRQTNLEYKQAFPQYDDLIAVVVDGDTPDIVEDGAAKLATTLRSRKDLYTDVFYLPEEPHFRRNRLLYLDVSELAVLADEISAAQPFLARLSGSPQLTELFDLLRLAVEPRNDGEESIRIDPALTAIAGVVNSVAEGAPGALSWQNLIAGDLSLEDGNRRVILVQPVLDYSQLLPGKTAVLTIRELAERNGLTAANGVRVRLTGSAALSYEELDSVTRGAARAGVLAFFCVAVCLVVGLRSVSLILATLVTLVIGLILTAAFATWAVGELNMISVAFAVLYVGLAAGFAIHYVLRVRELLGHHDKMYALTHSAVRAGGSITLCALTTAIGFYSFIPTDYSGVAELGLIAGTGMIIGLVTSMTVLPALLHYLPLRPPRLPEAKPALEVLAKFPLRNARTVTIACAMIAILSLAALPRASFNRNPLHLQDPTTESVQTFRDLLRESTRSPYSISIVAGDPEQARDLAARLETLPSVDSVVTLDDFVPTQQDEKLEIVDELALTLGPDLESDWEPTSGDSEAAAAAARSLAAVLGTHGGAAQTALAAALHRLTAGATRDPGMYRALETALFSGLRGRIEYLLDALEATAFTAEDLSAGVLDRWRTGDGRMRVEVLPEKNLDENEALAEFVAEVRGVAGAAATDTPVVIYEAGGAVIDAFQRALLSALVAIAALLWLILRNLREVILSLAPLLLAGLLTCAVMVVTNTSFNFANIIALPLLLGIGIDNALHILHRYRRYLPRDELVLTTSTARAVFFSALTTVCGFGNLAVSPHIGTASMGIVLSLGLVLIVAYALIALPAFVTLFPPAKRKPGTGVDGG